MNIYVITDIHQEANHVGWSMNHGLMDVLATTCNANFLFPEPIKHNRFFQDRSGKREDGANLLGRAWQRISKTWFDLEQLPTLGDGPNVLLVIGNSPFLQLAIFALGPRIHQFDLRINYILDGFPPEHMPTYSSQLFDHICVISEELAEQVQERYSIPTTCLPLATNTDCFGPHRRTREIDVMSYGRGNDDVHKALQQHFNGTGSERLYVHTTFDTPYVFDLKEHIALHTKLLARSKISLCFEASSVPRFSGFSPILYRWFEGWAAGCAIVGVKPFGKGVDNLLNWPDSTIEIPNSPKEWVPFFEDLLADERRLAEISWRNYVECRLRHDWRYRLQELFVKLGLQIPMQLGTEIQNLQATYRLTLTHQKAHPILEDDRDFQEVLQPNTTVRITA